MTVDIAPLASDAQELCEVQSDLSTADEKKFKEKNRHFWNTGERYLRAEYQVKVVIGPADIRFELCNMPHSHPQNSPVLGLI